MTESQSVDNVCLFECIITFQKYMYAAIFIVPGYVQI